jgi:hypothetical protein
MIGREQVETTDASWFDPATGVFRLDERVEESPEFRNIMADSVVTDAELMDYGVRVTGLLKALDGGLSPASHKQVGDALLALAVLHALQMRHAQQQAGGTYGSL